MKKMDWLANATLAVVEREKAILAKKRLEADLKDLEKLKKLQAKGDALAAHLRTLGFDVEGVAVKEHGDGYDVPVVSVPVAMSASPSIEIVFAEIWLNGTNSYVLPRGCAEWATRVNQIRLQIGFSGFEPSPTMSAEQTDYLTLALADVAEMAEYEFAPKLAWVGDLTYFGFDEINKFREAIPVGLHPKYRRAIRQLCNRMYADLLKVLAEVNHDNSEDLPF